MFLKLAFYPYLGLLLLVPPSRMLLLGIFYGWLAHIPELSALAHFSQL